MADPVRLLLISGSTRAASTSTAALRTLCAVAPEGVRAALYQELAVLPAFVPDEDQRPGAAVARLRRELAAAEAVLFCTPEYAGTLPGSLKNLLDWTVGSGELYGKPVAWIGVAQAGRGEGAQAALASVLGYVGALPVSPACVRLPVRRDALGADGLVADPAVRAGLRAVCEELVRHLRPGG